MSRRSVKIVPVSNGKVDPSILLGLGLAVEDDIENRKTHHDGELDHEHDDFDSFIVDFRPSRTPTTSPAASLPPPRRKMCCG